MSTVSIESKQLANGDRSQSPSVAQMQEVWAKLDCLGESTNGTVVWLSAEILEVSCANNEELVRNAVTRP